MAFDLKRLSELNGVAGCESEVREYILSELDGRCDDISVDALGNITAYKKGRDSSRKLLIGTNMDEVGLIADSITDKGYIKFKAVGAIDARMLISKRVEIVRSGASGVIGMKAVHLTTKKERETAVKIQDLYIDIGAKNKKTAEMFVKKGDYIAFDTRFMSLGDSIKGKALGRFGVVALMDAIVCEPAYDTYFVFSTQRETVAMPSGRGMMTAAYRIQPDYAVIIDTLSSDDTYRSERCSAKLGKGAVIEYIDKTSIADTKFTAAIAAFAESKGIMTQCKTASSCASITGAVTASARGAVAACVGIPCRYARTPVNIMNVNDIDAASKLCRAVVTESDVIINGIAQKTN